MIIRIRLALLVTLLLLTSSSYAQNKTNIFLDPIEKHKHWNFLSTQMDTVTLFPTYPTKEFPVMSKDLVDPQEGMLSKILAVRNAKYTVDVATYIFKRDAVGYALLEELKSAIKRGVSVRFLVDSLGSFHLFHGELKSLLAVEPGYMLDENGNKTNKKSTVEIRIFNSLSKGITSVQGAFDPSHTNSFLRWVNRRSHDKMLLADVQYPELSVVISGGRNLSESYYGMPQVDDKTYNDLESLKRDIPNNGADETLATTIGRHFDLLYYHQGNKTLDKNYWTSTNERHFKKMREASQTLIPPFSDIEQKLQRMAENKFLEANLKKVNAKFLFELHNLTRPHMFLPKTLFPQTLQNPNSIIDNTFELMAKATKSITIVSPYLYLADNKEKINELKLLRQWVLNDPTRKLTLILNSLITTDNLVAQGMVDSQIRNYVLSDHFKGLESQVEIYQLGKLDSVKLGGDKVYTKLHAKFVIIDNNILLITTSNGDGRSRKVNSELGFFLRETNPDDLEKYLSYEQDLISKSYNVRSPEWLKLQAHPKLKKKKFMANAAYDCVRILRLIDKDVHDLI